tara:strand:+ start:2008 stop:2292 length:285 start_codon:yes stop_codon:yes gene_type:complete
MSTEYIAAAAGAGRVEGADFTLEAGSSRLFYCKPSLGSNENLTLQIKSAGGYTSVGTLAGSGEPTGTVTATGEGSSVFRVIRSAVSVAKPVYFD